MIKEYDKRGNLIHYSDNKGFEFWSEFDEHNNLVHCKYSKSFEYWSEEEWRAVEQRLMKRGESVEEV